MKTKKLNPKLTYTFGETLGYAMGIKTQAEADAYFKELIDYSMAKYATPRRSCAGSAPRATRSRRRMADWLRDEWGGLPDASTLTREKAEENCRSSLGYYAGYYSNETRERVERLFKCAHPIFGSIRTEGAPTFQKAFAAGKKLGEQARRASVKAMKKRSTR